LTGGEQFFPSKKSAIVFLNGILPSSWFRLFGATEKLPSSQEIDARKKFIVKIFPRTIWIRDPLASPGNPNLLTGAGIENACKVDLGAGSTSSVIFPGNHGNRA